MPEESWLNLGEPREITITVEPGDTLNAHLRAVAEYERLLQDREALLQAGVPKSDLIMPDRPYLPPAERRERALNQIQEPGPLSSSLRLPGWRNAGGKVHH